MGQRVIIKSVPGNDVITVHMWLAGATGTGGGIGGVGEGVELVGTENRCQMWGCGMLGMDGGETTC